ncbi:hypothetical protein GCM10023116_14920 [Kistimonas scapharcae]|uniref:Secreted protein n=1 Tax=Kistimonas scapharcae TaxID=1036133 RepID=A0ABP8UZ33_9GAMM
MIWLLSGSVCGKALVWQLWGNGECCLGEIGVGRHRCFPFSAASTGLLSCDATAASLPLLQTKSTGVDLQYRGFNG